MVLTTGQIWQQKGDDNKPVVVNTVTLELTPHESEVLNLASSNEGKIRLALRNRNNKTVAETEGVTTSFLLGGATNKKEQNSRRPTTHSGREEHRGYQGLGTVGGQALAAKRVIIAPNSAPGGDYPVHLRISDLFPLFLERGKVLVGAR